MVNRKEKPLLWILVPCFNEEEVIPITAPKFLEALDFLIKKGKVSEQSKICFVNDGSTDATWDIIVRLSKEDDRYIGISQSRNRGHQSTLLAGLMEAKDQCDITVSIDCDGQDDIYVMEKMIDHYRNGYEIVYGVRSKRSSDSFFKRVTAELFYKLMNHMGTELIYNHADFRLVSNKVLKYLADYKEVNLFLRGLFPLIGFKSTRVYYERIERAAGTSHYSFRKMAALAIEGVTSFSIKPLHVITSLGVLISIISFIGVIWTVVTYIKGNVVAGWTSMTCIICFLGGVQLASLGVIGEYVGKIYMETKGRTRYIISERTCDQEEQ